MLQLKIFGFLQYEDLGLREIMMDSFINLYLYIYTF